MNELDFEFAIEVPKGSAADSLLVVSDEWLRLINKATTGYPNWSAAISGSINYEKLGWYETAPFQQDNSITSFNTNSKDDSDSWYAGNFENVTLHSKTHSFDCVGDLTALEYFGWHVNPNVSDPYDAVTYIGGAVGRTPAIMGETFSYGDWANAFFLPKPCMLRFDGTVDYYLDPNDYTKKADGTPSDIADPTYDGNAMMEWPLIWWKYEAGETEGEGSFYVSNVKVDNTYDCYCNINCDNQIVEHFYTAIYNGTGTTKLRSLSGVALTAANGNSGTTYTQESTRAMANNTTAKTEWFIDVWSDRMLINGLLILMGKSLNSQATFGRGLDTGGQAAKEAYVTGALNDKGLFWGDTSAGTSGVKVFGMENWYGCVGHRTAGLISAANNKYAYKMTMGTYDGTTATEYNTDASGYKTVGTRPVTGYFNKAIFGQFGYLPIVTSASSASTYYCDYYYNGTSFALVGGDAYDRSNVGASYVFLNNDANMTFWYIAAALSCKPINPPDPTSPPLPEMAGIVGVFKYGGLTGTTWENLAGPSNFTFAAAPEDTGYEYAIHGGASNKGDFYDATADFSNATTIYMLVRYDRDNIRGLSSLYDSTMSNGLEICDSSSYHAVRSRSQQEFRSSVQGKNYALIAVAAQGTTASIWINGVKVKDNHAVTLTRQAENAGRFTLAYRLPGTYNSNYSAVSTKFIAFGTESQTDEQVVKNSRYIMQKYGML